jgi:hypothetical protein
LYRAKDTLGSLPNTEAAPGSPLSYGERGDRARSLLDELRRAVFVTVPLLPDQELAPLIRRTNRVSPTGAAPRDGGDQCAVPALVRAVPV